jgi:hypothetical protein
LSKKIGKLKRIVKTIIRRFVRIRFVRSFALIVNIKRIFTKLMILSLNKNKLMKFLSLPLIIQARALASHKNLKDSNVL